jgi:hypothetical protein
MWLLPCLVSTCELHFGSGSAKHIADGGKDIVQAEILYKCLETLRFDLHVRGANRVCQVAKLRVHVQARKVSDCVWSLLYHLNQFKKKGIVRVIEA